MPSISYMGGVVRRREDPRLIRGLATYVDDIVLPNLAYMAVLRSPYPHARILDIDVSAALDLPGVLAAVTGREVAGLVATSQGEGGESSRPGRPPLADEVARYIGDGVVAVVAAERAVAEDALEHVAVEWEELPGVGDPEAARRPQAPLVDADTPRNVDDRHVFSHGDVERAFNEAAVTASVRLVSQRLAPTPMETRGVVASYDRGSESLTLWSSTQCAHFVRDAVCDALDMSGTRVRVIAPEVGGGFGCKTDSYSEDILAAYMARKLGRPVKWIETRSESMQATSHGRSQIGYVDLAATSEGRIIGLRLHVILDSGASGTGWLAETSAKMVTGCYDIENVYAEAETVLTNKTPVGAYRGAGRPEAAYFIERAIDVLAAKMQLEPADIRRRNFIPSTAFPYTTANGSVYDTGEYASTLDTALETCGYRHWIEERDRARQDGRLVGVGMASYVEVCGIGWETATARVLEDGSVTIYTGISPHGQGQETTFSQIAADLLGVTPDRVTVQYGDTDLGSGFGTMGSRGTAVGGAAVYNAALAVADKMRQIAAHLLEAAPEDLELDEGAWGVRGVPASRVSVAAVADAAYDPDKLPDGMEPGLTAVNNFNPGEVTAPFGTHVAMVEVDQDTGQVEILRYLSMDDCGTIISPQLVEGQVHGGLTQGIAQAIFEEVVYSDDGRLLTGSLADYAIPTAADVPHYETAHTHTPSPRNPMGVKGIGEAATIGSTPTIVNAVLDALSLLGIVNLDMPLTPERLWRAMDGAGSTRRA